MGGIWSSVSKPGLCGYTSGFIRIHSPNIFYVYIGATGSFNSANASFASSIPGGGSTDILTIASESWFLIDSLNSMIIVAGGGGGAKWVDSIGGNGGGLSGGISFSSIYHMSLDIFPEHCFGANQTHCGVYPDYTEYLTGHSGSYGISESPASSSNMGGYGGGEYFGGGSSFVSGYHGCDSKSNHRYIFHTNSPFHYSGYYFCYVKMISGSTTMPLPTGNEGMWSDLHG